VRMTSSASAAPDPLANSKSLWATVLDTRVAFRPVAPGNPQTALFFGTLLCVLLAFFAVERRVAAYPTDNVAAASVAATGVQKPPELGVPAQQSVKLATALLCLIPFLTLLPFFDPCRHGISTDSLPGTSDRISTPLAIRPPPAL
jgi:hypothetical protein